MSANAGDGEDSAGAASGGAEQVVMPEIPS